MRPRTASRDPALTVSSLGTARPVVGSPSRSPKSQTISRRPLTSACSTSSHTTITTTRPQSHAPSQPTESQLLSRLAALEQRVAQQERTLDRLFTHVTAMDFRRSLDGLAEDLTASIANVASQTSEQLGLVGKDMQMLSNSITSLQKGEAASMKALRQQSAQIDAITRDLAYIKTLWGREGRERK
ncbi:hypothetical protein GMRT_16328 [Giardia muris]|uniref:Uncharacterized protein n=1 Tax=Giardia muris TaxID=5742 RepID=A0A4Z1SV47_GIAMU|nr:hypothetical protein GMRT_16328 [Giardia muris]|eukprot:TNJ29674.1 hypothetical protein GMRT_16328 [Giardia muris]